MISDREGVAFVGGFVGAMGGSIFGFMYDGWSGLFIGGLCFGILGCFGAVAAIDDEDK